MPNIIPALPRVPLQPRKENADPKPTPNSAATSGSGSAITQLGNGLAGMRLHGGVPDMPPMMLQPQPVAEKDTALLDNGREAARLEPRPRSSPNFGTATDAENAPREVLRYPAVPLSHDVSQTSKLKETMTIMVGGDTIQISAQTQNESPEQAAERAVHSGFMREALDMVSLAFFGYYQAVLQRPASSCHALSPCPCAQCLLQNIWKDEGVFLIPQCPSRQEVAQYLLCIQYVSACPQLSPVFPCFPLPRFGPP